MNPHLEIAYNGSFDWSLWEFEIRSILDNKDEKEDRLGNKIFLIQVDDERAGFIWSSLQDKRKTLWIDSIVILPEFQGRGLGTKIIDLVALHYPEIDKIELGVQKTNKKALNFYKKIGFSQIEDIKIEYYNTFRMRKKLIRALSKVE